ncbi:MAG: sensor histidine kinase [Endomicrobiales bacterium]
MKIEALDKLFGTLSLRYKIIALFILAILLPALLFSVILTSISRSALRDSIYYQQQETINRVADRISAQFDRYQKPLLIHRDIASYPRARQLSAARNILQQDNAFSEIALVNPLGQEIWKLRRGGPARDLVNRARNWKEYPLARAQKFFISKLDFSRDQQPFIMLTLALPGRKGMLLAKLDFNKMRIWEWISEVQIGEYGHAFVVDREGGLIAHPEPERVRAHSNFSALPVVRDFLEHRSLSPGEWRRYRDERGEKVVALYRELPRLGWAVVTQIPSKEVYRPIKRMYQNIFFWTLFWSLVFLYVGYRFVQRIINPLSLLEAGVQKISQGKLDIELDIRTGDEIESLARSFETMAGSLRQLEELKQDLTRMIVHDLKSPLSGIMGSLDYLESGILGEFTGDQKKIISLAKKSSESLLSMIQNMLDVAKMEEGKLELKKEKVYLSSVIGERKLQYEALVASEGKSITAEVEPGLPPLEIEKNLVERVLNNLLSNAVNHTTSGGTIRMRLRRIEGFIEVSVADDGAGVPPEYRDKIFEKFVQVKRRQAHLRTGAGLGLTFCKMVVETHGGSIRVESELNKGSSFVFTLPL